MTDRTPFNADASETRKRLSRIRTPMLQSSSGTGATQGITLKGIERRACLSIAASLTLIQFGEAVACSPRAQSNGIRRNAAVPNSMEVGEIRFIQVEGLRIRTMRTGGSKAVPILLTSPWPESLYAFSRIWPQLSAAAPVVAVDLPGFGQSEGGVELMSPRAMGAFMAKLLAALGLSRVHGVGPDVGTAALLFAASERPDLFESLVVGSGLIDVSRAAGRLKDLIGAPNTDSFVGIDGAALATSAIDRMMQNKPSPAVLKDYQLSSSGARFSEAIAYVRAYRTDLAALQALLPDINTPVLSIWGFHDAIVPPDNAAVLNNLLPRTRSVVFDSGHFVWEDCAKEYADAVTGWINGAYRNV